jgi:hypothetical protein
MSSTKKKASAKTVVKFRDLKSKKSPKGGTISWSGSDGDEALKVKGYKIT